MRLWLLVLSACGRFGFAPDAAVTASDAADTPIDAPDAALGAFATPVVIAELSDPAAFDSDPALTADLLEIYFTSDRTGSQGRDLWRSVRATALAPWPAPQRVIELASPVEDAAPHLSADGLTIWFSSARAPATAEIWVATRPTRTAAWSTPSPVVEVNTPGGDRGFAVIASGLAAYFGSATASTEDLFRTTRVDVTSPWEPPVPVAGVNTPTADEENPIASRDERVIVFASDRPGGLGQADLYVATRGDVSEPFGAAMPLVELNSPDYDSDPWYGDEGRLIVFASSRTGARFDLYMSTR